MIQNTASELIIANVYVYRYIYDGLFVDMQVLYVWTVLDVHTGIT